MLFNKINCLVVAISIIFLHQSSAKCHKFKKWIGNYFPNLNKSHISEHHIIDSMNATFQRMLNKAKDKYDFAKLLGEHNMLEFHKENIMESPKPTSNSEAEEAFPACCQPMMATVNLATPDDPFVAYYPTCVNLERCGGCCYGELLSCQPEETQKVKLKVLKISSEPLVMTTGSRRHSEEPVQDELIVDEERHLSCACKCTTKPSQCDHLTQEFHENECACRCKDKTREKACFDLETTHFWDAASCACFCRQKIKCSTGFFFDHNTCRCLETTYRYAQPSLYGNSNG